MKSRSLVFSYFLLPLLVFSGCRDNQNRPRQQSNYEPEKRTQPVFEFNISDKSVVTNGNFSVAFTKLLKLGPAQVWQTAHSVSPAKITRNIYSSIGSLYRMKGLVYKIEEVPENQNFHQKWNGILMVVEDPNSAFGATNVTFIYSGDDIEKIDPNTYITCAGYFVGTSNGQNAYGGTIESLVLVGNAFRNESH